MSVFAFRPEPQGAGMTVSDLLLSGLDAPLSLGSTFWDQVKGGILASPGLGTAIRSATLPPKAPTSPGFVYTPRGGGEETTIPPELMPPMFSGTLRMETPQELSEVREQEGALAEDSYKASPHFRDDIPWDAGMTADRAAALAEQSDVRRVREFYAAKRPITAFFGTLTGAAVDPINYIPIAGEAVVAANVARFGRVAGRALTASADAMSNTAIAAVATAPTRRQFGDDVSWQTTLSQIAMSGLIGAAFGTAAGALSRGIDPKLRADAETKLATLQRTQEARAVLNDAIDGMARNGEVRLSEASAGFAERAARVVSDAANGSRTREIPVANITSPEIVAPAPAPQSVGDFGVDPVSGDFAELAELNQLRAEGRLTEEDAADIEAADETFRTATAYGEALKAAMTCVI